MAYQIPYSGATYRPPNDLIPGNQAADNPVEFDLVPAAGADLARLKSVIYAAAGLVDGSWSPDLQAAVIAAFDQGGDVFARTVTAVRGLTVPAAAALRFGVISELPKTADVPSGDPKAPVVISNGWDFSRVAGLLTALALALAFEVAKLSKAEAVDPRFFGRPSGSSSPGTRRKRISTADSVPNGSRRPETAGSPAPTASPDPGTSR